MAFGDPRQGGQPLPPIGDDPALADAQPGAGETSGEVAAPAIVQPGPDREQMDKLKRWADPLQTPNIADELDESKLSGIGQKAKQEYDVDINSRDGWMKKSEDAIKLAMQVAEAKTYPWPNASNIIYPLMTNAAIQFNARAMPAIIPARSLVKGVVWGKDDGDPQLAPDGSPAVKSAPGPDGRPQPAMGPNGQPQIIWKTPPGGKKARADRIGEHMSWQLLEEMPEWEPETDKLLMILPIIGCAFRKTFFDSNVGCNSSVLVLPQNLVVNYWAKCLERAPRITEEQKIYPVEIEENQRAKIWIDHDFGVASGGGNDADHPHEFLEQHRRIDLDGDGYPEPYIVTLHKPTGKVVRIVARYDLDGIMLSQADHKIRMINPVDYYTQYDFLPNIEGGLYGMGFGQLLSPINAAVNTLINELIDSGNLANTQGGFIGKGLSMHAGSVKFKKGEFKTVNVPGSTIRDAIVPMKFEPPSDVLFRLLGTLVEAGKEISSVQDVLTGDVKASTMQPTTLLALIEQGLKVFTGIYKRIYKAEKNELRKLFRLNRLFMDREAQYQVGDEWKTIQRSDYETGGSVVPVSDPAMVSDMQKAARAQFLQGYQNDPHMDQIAIRKRVFDAASVENVDELFAKQMGPPPQLILAQQHALNETIKTRAAAINQLAQAQMALAKADATAGATAMALITHHFELLQGELTQLAAPPGPAPGAVEAPPVTPEAAGLAPPPSPDAGAASAAAAAIPAGARAA